MADATPGVEGSEKAEPDIAEPRGWCRDERGSTAFDEGGSLNKLDQTEFEALTDGAEVLGSVLNQSNAAMPYEILAE